ncbi:MAG: hypothetical protein AB7P99_12700 [Vicinamibacterales bacterium]|uniref:hypothetical protein n=1 Tax=Ramlibacter sp. TaxID=1917967 RepID=UPI003D13980E
MGAAQTESAGGDKKDAKPQGDASGNADKQPADKQAGKEMTAAAAAKRVKRSVFVERKKVGQDKDGNDVFEDVFKDVDVKADEVLSFKDYGTHVVVVTKDGKKFSDKAED